MAALQARLPGVPMRRTDELGVPEAGKEALVFAIIGFLTLHGLPATVPSCTGAARPSVLGSVTPGTVADLLARPCSHRPRRGQAPARAGRALAPVPRMSRPPLARRALPAGPTPASRRDRARRHGRERRANRCWRCAAWASGSGGAGGPPRSSAASTSRSSRARSSASWARAGRARPSPCCRCCGCCPTRRCGCCGARSPSPAGTSARSTTRPWPGCGAPRSPWSTRTR